MKIGGKTKRKRKLHRHLSLKSFVRKTWLKRFGIHRGFVGLSTPPLAGGQGEEKTLTAVTQEYAKCQSSNGDPQTEAHKGKQ